MDNTPPVPKELREAVDEALDTLTAVTGVDADALFGTRVVENLEALPASAAYAGGFLEGAALACGLTVLEFLDLVAREA
jgi:hypothetical protein